MLIKYMYCSVSVLVLSLITIIVHAVLCSWSPTLKQFMECILFMKLLSVYSIVKTARSCSWSPTRPVLDGPIWRSCAYVLVVL